MEVLALLLPLGVPIMWFLRLQLPPTPTPFFLKNIHLIARDLSRNGKCAFENRSPGKVAASDTQNHAPLLASSYCPAEMKRCTELWLDFQSSSQDWLGPRLCVGGSEGQES